MPSRCVEYVPEASPDLPSRYSVESVIESNGAETTFMLLDKQLSIYLLGKQVAYFADSTADHSEVIGQTFIMKYLERPTLIRVYDIFYAPYKSSYTLVTEYLPQSLYSIVEADYLEGRKVSETFIWECITKITDALIYLHSPWNKSYRDNQGNIVQIGRIVHRRINPQTILFSSAGQLKLSNFVLSASTEVMRSTYSMFHLSFIAPEVLSGEELYSLKSDIWSLGCVIYYMCTGKPCFHGANPDELINNVVGQRYVPLRDTNVDYSDALFSLVDRLLQPNRVDRPTATELLEHPCIIKTMRELGMSLDHSNSCSISPQLEQPPVATKGGSSKNTINIVSLISDGVNFKQVELSHKTPTTAIKSALSTIPLTCSHSNSGMPELMNSAGHSDELYTVASAVHNFTTESQDSVALYKPHTENEAAVKQAMNRSSTLSLHPVYRSDLDGTNQLSLPRSTDTHLTRTELRSDSDHHESIVGYKPADIADQIFGEGYELTSSISTQDLPQQTVADMRMDYSSNRREPVISALNNHNDINSTSPKPRLWRTDSLGDQHSGYEGIQRSDTYCYDDGEPVSNDGVKYFSRMQHVSDSDHDDGEQSITPCNNDINMSLTPHNDQVDSYTNMLNMNGEYVKEAIAKAKFEVAMDQESIRDIDIPQAGMDRTLVAIGSGTNVPAAVRSMRIDPSFNTDSIHVEQPLVQQPTNVQWPGNNAVHDSKANETISSITVMRASRIKPTIESFQSRMEANVAARKTMANLSDVDHTTASFVGASIREASTMSMRARELVSHNIYQDNSFYNPTGEYYTLGTGPVQDAHDSPQGMSAYGQTGADVDRAAHENYEVFGDRPYVTPAESEPDRWHSTLINGMHPTMSFRLNIQEDTNFKGQTPLMEAVLNGSVDDVYQNLTWTGAQDNMGLTALMLAVINKKIEMVHILLPYEKQMQDKAGWTALMWASHNNYISLIDMLLVEATMRDIYGRTALMIAAQNGYVSVVDHLFQSEACMQRKDGYTALMHAASCGIAEVDYIHTDREFGKPYHASSGSNQTTNNVTIELIMLTHRGSQQDYMDVIELLYKAESGLTSNKLCSYGAGLTALMIAANFNFAPACSLLYSRESSLHQSDGKRAEDYTVESNAYDARLALEHKVEYQKFTFVEAEADLGSVKPQNGRAGRNSAKKSKANPRA